MRVYIAASFDSQVSSRILADAIDEEGHEIVSTWIHQTVENSNEDPENAGKFAMRDFHELRAADAVVVATDIPSSGGGLHVETGLALAWNKLVILYGPRTNVFHWLPEVTKAPSIQAIVDILATRFTRLAKTPDGRKRNTNSV